MSTTGKVGGAGAQRDHTRLLDAGDQLPPLPAVTLALTDETRLLPTSAAHPHLHARYRSRTRPRHATDGQFTASDLVVRPWLGDQSPHALQRDRLADALTLAFPFIPILVNLIIPCKRPVDDLDFGQPFDRCHGIPAGNNEAHGIAVLNG